MEEIYTVYCDHKVWGKVIGPEAVQATMALAATNSGSMALVNADKGMAKHSPPSTIESSGRKS
jgi:hypothetical protein